MFKTCTHLQHRTTMKSLALTFGIALLIGQQKITPVDSGGNTEHGKYLVENVAMCIQCHTPREENGDLALSRMLFGAPVPVSRPYPFQRWAEYAPRIAGLPQYTEEQMLKLLTTGIGRDGTPLRAPMPPFRLTQQDALDVVAYLKSLP